MKLTGELGSPAPRSTEYRMVAGWATIPTPRPLSGCRERSWTSTSQPASRRTSAAVSPPSEPPTTIALVLRVTIRTLSSRTCACDLRSPAHDRPSRSHTHRRPDRALVPRVVAVSGTPASARGDRADDAARSDQHLEAHHHDARGHARGRSAALREPRGRRRLAAVRSLGAAGLRRRPARRSVPVARDHARRGRGAAAGAARAGRRADPSLRLAALWARARGGGLGHVLQPSPGPGPGARRLADRAPRGVDRDGWAVVRAPGEHLPAPDAPGPGRGDGGGGRRRRELRREHLDDRPPAAARARPPPRRPGRRRPRRGRSGPRDARDLPVALSRRRSVRVPPRRLRLGPTRKERNWCQTPRTERPDRATTATRSSSSCLADGCACSTSRAS